MSIIRIPRRDRVNRAVPCVCIQIKFRVPAGSGDDRTADAKRSFEKGVPKRSLGTRSGRAPSRLSSTAGQGSCTLISTECRDWRGKCEPGRADPELGVPAHGIGDWFWSVFGKPEEREVEKGRARSVSSVGACGNLPIDFERLMPQN